VSWTIEAEDDGPCAHRPGCRMSCTDLTGPGVPVVRMLHIDYDPDGRTLQVAHDLFAGDRHEFAFEREQDGSNPGG
jgi:hypothetical protein